MKLRAFAVAGALLLGVFAHGSTSAATASLDLVEPLAEYKIYVSRYTQKLVDETRAFVAAIKAGDVEKAKALYAPTRQNYETIEPIAELFSDLDSAIDARVDDFEKGTQDPAFTGFHRLEYGLWNNNSTDGLQDYAERLEKDVTDLQQRIAKLTFPPEIVVGGAAGLMEEVAASKISGEEDRYSHTDLWDFQANVTGARKIFELVRPLIAGDDPDFVAKVRENFETVDDTLDKYRTDDGYETYDKLSDADRNVLSASVNKLAEDLSTLRGKLGLS